MNKPIIVTAPPIYNSALISALHKQKRKAVSAAVIETILFDNPHFETVFQNIKSYDYIILPSKTAIHSFVYQLKKRNIAPQTLPTEFIAIGKDKEELEKHNLLPMLAPKEPSTQGIVNLLRKTNKNNPAILLLTPKVEIIPEPAIIPSLISGLKEIGGLTFIEGYITKPVHSLASSIIEMIRQNNYQLIALSSGGEALALKKNFPEIYSQMKIACFGPYTAQTAIKEGFKPLLIGSKFSSFEDYAQTINHFLSQQK